jgi:MYXO-CTERM domain-containing protein
VCPASIANHEHNDSEPMTAALWATRRQADNPRGVDRMVIEALARVAPDDTLDGTANIMLDVAQTFVQEGTLTPDTYDVLVRSFGVRGLLDCPRIIADPPSVRAGRRMSLLRVNESVAPFWPSSMQLRYEVPAGDTEIVVRMGLRASEDTDPIVATVLVKFGDAPIEFTYDLAAVDDPPPEGEESDEEPIRDLVLVGGDWDLELTPERWSESEFEVRIGGRQPGEVVHVTVVDSGPTNLSVSDLRVLGSTEFDPLAPEEDDDEIDPDDAPEEVAPGPVISACTCRTPGGGVDGWGLLLLVLGGSCMRRRRWPT